MSNWHCDERLLAKLQQLQSLESSFDATLPHLIFGCDPTASFAASCGWRRFVSRDLSTVDLPGNVQTVVVLPGGRFQTSLIRKIQSCGYRVVCADRSADCPGSKIADGFIPVGVDQRDQLLKEISRWNPSAIITDQTDAGVTTVAWLCEQLGLPGIGVEHAELFTNKFRMREFSRQHHFNSPDFRLCHDLPSAVDAASAIGYPVVIKPLQSQSSKGVYCVRNQRELESQLAETQRHCFNNQFLVEQFLEGTEFTVEGFQSGTGHVTLAISEKAHFRDAPMVASSLEYLPVNSQFDYDELRRINDSWVNASGLRFGITHAEYIFSRGQFYLVEIAARGGGTRIASDIVPWVSGTDPQLLLLESALGGNSVLQPPSEPGRCALLEFFDWSPGRVRQITGLEEARASSGVLEVSVSVDAGQVIAPVQDDTSRPGFFILTTENLTQLHELREYVLETVKVDCE